MLTSAALTPDWELSLWFSETPGILSFCLPGKPQFPVSPQKCFGCSLCPWRGSTEAEVGRWGRRSAVKSPVVLHRSREMEAFRECHRQQTPGAFQAVFTHIADKQTNKKGIQTFPLRFTEHFNANTNNSQRLSLGGKKHEFCLWSKHQTADQTTAVHLNS